MTGGKVYPARQIGGPPRLPSQWESRAAYRAAVEKAEALHEQEVMVRTHERLQKLNAKLVAEGRPPAWSCPPSCSLCHPPVEPKPTKRGKVEVEKVKDLRGGTVAEKLKGRGRKGKRCKTCGGPLPSKRHTYCSPECRYGPKDASSLPEPVRCAWCGKPTGGTKWCDDSCRCKAYRARRRKQS